MKVQKIEISWPDDKEPLEIAVNEKYDRILRSDADDIFKTISSDLGCIEDPETDDEEKHIEAFYQEDPKIFLGYLKNSVIWSEEFLSCKVFSSKHSKYHDKLKKYLFYQEYYGQDVFDEMTNGVGHLNSFRSCLNKYIKSIKPYMLSEKERIFVIAGEDGEFKLSGDGNFSKQVLNKYKIGLEYYSFLMVNRFWAEIAELTSNLPSEYPLLILDDFKNDEPGEDLFTKVRIESSSQVIYFKKI